MTPLAWIFLIITLIVIAFTAPIIYADVVNSYDV